MGIKNGFKREEEPIFQKILEAYQGEIGRDHYRRIKRPAKQLLQKCSLQSICDTSRLCELAYWLYFDGKKELALELCELIHGVEFDVETGWATGIPMLFGLEVRIARECLGEDRRDQIPPAFLRPLQSDWKRGDRTVSQAQPALGSHRTDHSGIYGLPEKTGERPLS